jgi:aminoglycoside/choline kinase family phosphotransferase
VQTEDLLQEEQSLLASSRQVLNLADREPLTLTPILKGGSDRHFFRLRGANGQSWIVMHYGIERRENSLFADIAAFLQKLDVPVPRVLHHDATRRVLWMNDLGVTDLHTASANGESPDLPLYEATIGAVATLHRNGWELARREGLQLMPGFDEALYAWERNYFYEEFLGTVCERPLSPAEQEKIEADLSPLAATLAQQSGDLVHRDFQSQNIIISGGKPFLIDFQGMRLGMRHYDLASLIFDPYVNMSDANRELLISIAFRLDANGQNEAAFRRDLQCAAIQRLMQALGAYGMLGVKKEKTEFLRHIPRALMNLQAVLGQGGCSDALLDILSNITANARRLRR